MSKELVKKITIAVLIFIAIIFIVITVYIAVNNTENTENISESVNEFKVDYNKIYEGKLFKIEVNKDGTAIVYATDYLKQELNNKESIYNLKFESNIKKKKLLEEGINVSLIGDNAKKEKFDKAYEYSIGNNIEESAIAFVLTSGQAALLTVEDIFSGETLEAKEISNLKNVQYFINLKNINKKSDSYLNEGYNLVAVVKGGGMWNIVIDKESNKNNIYKNSTEAKIPVTSFKDSYYQELPNNLYISKNGYAYFSKKPESFSLNQDFTGFNEIDNNKLENVLVGGTDNIKIAFNFSTSSIINEFNYMFIAENGNLYILPKTVIETETGTTFVAKTVNNVTNVKYVELYQFLNDDDKLGIEKNKFYTVVTYKNGTKEILKSDRYMNN